MPDNEYRKKHEDSSEITHVGILKMSGREVKSAAGRGMDEAPAASFPGGGELQDRRAPASFHSRTGRSR